MPLKYLPNRTIFSCEICHGLWEKYMFSCDTLYKITKFQKKKKKYEKLDLAPLRTPWSKSTFQTAISQFELLLRSLHGIFSREVYLSKWFRILLFFSHFWHLYLSFSDSPLPFFFFLLELSTQGKQYNVSIQGSKIIIVLFQTIVWLQWTVQDDTSSHRQPVWYSCLDSHNNWQKQS